LRTCILRWSAFLCPPFRVIFGFLIYKTQSMSTPSSQRLKVRFIFCLFGFGGNGIWTHSLTFARQPLYHLNHIPSPFCFSYFFPGRVLVFLPKLTLDLDPPTYSCWVRVILSPKSSFLKFRLGMSFALVKSIDSRGQGNLSVWNVPLKKIVLEKLMVLQNC
jgi:hypothetical protein